MFYQVLLMIIGLCVAFELKCPEPSQWSMRSRLLCHNPLFYYCLLSIDGKRQTYTESCSQVDFDAPGRRIIIRLNFDSFLCSHDKYQPIKYWTNVSSDCLFLTSKCTENGQVLFREDLYRELDASCTCDATRDYSFVVRPKNACFCIPSEEDCSCYKRRSSFINSTLSQDYKNTEETHDEAREVCKSFNTTRVDTVKVILPLLSNIQETIQDYTDYKGYKRKTDVCAAALVVTLIYICVIAVVVLCECPINEYFRKGPYLRTIMQTIDYKDKKENRRFIRIFIIGKEGVGKTSLLRRLMREEIKDVKSTDGIDIDVRRCSIQADGKWITVKEPDAKIELLKRIKRAINEKESPEDNMIENIYDVNGINTNAERTLDGVNSEITRVNEPENLPKMSLSPNKLMPQLEDSYESKTEVLDEIDISSKSDDREHVQKPTSNITSEVIEEIATELDVFLRDINKSDVHQDIVYELGFWDFAGEREYYETHHTFLNQNALFLLVTSISDDIKNGTEDIVLKSVGEYISFWFDTVHSCGNPKDLTPDGKLNPSIIVVCTGIDKWDCKDATELKTKEDAYKVKLIDNMTPIHGQHFREICFVSNKEPLKYKKGFEELRNFIFTYGKTLKTCNEKLPVKWILLERSLDVLKEGGLNILSYAEIKKLSNKCSIESEDEIKRFLEYQHKVGNIIYFENVLECIILSQQWLANVFKCLVTNKVETKLKVREDWKELENTGELKDSLLKELFMKIPEINLSEYKPHILEILKAFHILAKPLEIEKYYMPCMVTKTTTISDLFTMFAVKSDMCTPWLIFDFDFMPFSMFNHVLVYFLREYFVCKERSSNKSAIYHGKAVFYLDAAKGNQIFACYVQNAIALQIWKRKEFKSKVTCIKLLIDLKTEMRKLTQTFATNNLLYTVKAKCSHGNIDTVKGRVTLEDLCSSKGDDYYCEEHCSMHKMDELLKTWFESCQVCHKEPSVYCCNDCYSSMCKYCTHQHMETTDTSHNIVPHVEDICTLDYNFKVKVELISDIKMLHNGLLVIADWDGKQLLTCHITEHRQQHTIPLPNFPYYIAVVDKNTVAVTLFTVTTVLIVDVRKRQVMKRIDVKVMCYGIMYRDNQLFLGCSDKTIKIMNMSGELTHTIRTDVLPMYICGGEAFHFYYTDWNKLYCIDACGNTLFKFNDVSDPWAFTVDDKGQVLVIYDKLKNKVRSITADGKQSHVIISQIPSSYWNPYICYDPLSKSVVIGRDKTVYIYK